MTAFCSMFLLPTHHANLHLSFVGDNLLLCTDYAENCFDVQSPCEDRLRRVYPSITQMAVRTCLINLTPLLHLYFQFCCMHCCGTSLFMLLNRLSNNDCLVVLLLRILLLLLLLLFNSFISNQNYSASIS
jgi:hypothetical protein